MSVKLQIVTGILGSGKTSVLKHLLDTPDPTGWPAVLVGEFAEEGFDADMLRAVGVPVKQVASMGGKSEAEAYVGPLRQLVDSGDHGRVFLETSGVSEIDSLIRALRDDPQLSRELEFGPTLTVLDAGSFYAHSEHFAAQLWGQVDVADYVVINKTDKAPHDASLTEMRKAVEARNPQAEVRFAYMGQIRRSEILDPQPEGFTPRLHFDFERDAKPRDFDAFVYRSELVCFDRILLGHRLLNVPGRIARFKGVLRCWDRSYCVNGMPGQLDWDNTPVKGKTCIAVIGLGLAKMRSEIVGILDQELEGQQEGWR